MNLIWGKLSLSVFLLCLIIYSYKQSNVQTYLNLCDFKCHLHMALGGKKTIRMCIKIAILC